ncbi:hypothetical protein AYO20_01861 [Fonsecaea nubica]|uniref:MIT domain-containing protein n=1 Tax=Fonsecaea nubica TaxID=856822 RepID=A0A178DC10_9EURO|nr:hypothetical protein AYO20_01861 [Fonsecaea nubica]OAL38655.1 hypothetical protein AYO20_01861 [Fonsecaea nubica]
MDTSGDSVVHNSRRSRSNSTSSPAPTVRKQSTAVGLQHLDSRNVHLRTRPRSPESSMPLTSRFRYDRSRSRSRPENSLSPNLNINRWSHSTSSSVSGIEADAIRTRANTSRRMSIGPSLVSSSAQGKTSMHKRRSSSQSPQARQGSGSAFLQVERTHALRDTNPLGVSPHLTPTSMFNPSAGEYFGETWQSRKTGKNGEAVAVSVHYMRTSPQPTMRSSENVTTQYMTQATLPSTRENRPTTNGRDGSMDDSAPPHVPARVKSHRSPTQKTMLSKALAVANTAVLLDNAQNIEGAIEAYAEACELLQQVLIRSSVLDDRKRLSDIRNAYSKRIADLHDLDNSFSDLMEKALPEDPPLDETNNSFFSSDGIEPDTTEVLESVQIPPRQESLLPEIFGGESYLNEASARKRIHIPSLAVPMDAQYMPPPLSPRRPSSPTVDRDANTPLATRRPSDAPTAALHTREGSTESTSWLDTLEDGDSTTSRSSRLSSLDFGIQNNHHIVDDFEAEFDAALDAAVDAAYDDNLTEEPTPRPDKNMQDFSDDFSTPVPPPFQPASNGHSLLSSDVELTREYDEGESSEEEERLLEEMTKGFVFDDFSFDNKSKSALPRQSDSSTFSGRTWTSSLPSTTATNNTTLSTLAESLESSAETSPPPIPPAKDSPLTSPPKTVLSQAPPMALPGQPSSRPVSIEKYSGLNIRERRFSGRSGEQLKIETFVRRNSSTIPIKPIAAPPSVPDLDVPVEQQKASQTGEAEPIVPSLAPITPMTTLPSNDSVQSESPGTPALTQGGSQGSIEDSAAMPPSPAKTGKMGPPAAVKKNLSSSSLRVRNLSVATTEISAESPITPISAGFGADSRKVVPPLPSAALPTPSTAAFGPQLLQTGGMYLFDDITATDPPRTPRSPDASSVSPPQLLEPCPESFLLRPFWLMRCLYQTLAHPSGGYLTTKLFIPRDVWKVRNVKLKALDDKVSQCDLLTAALLKIAKVDTFDADSVLDELQAFEAVLEQVRNTLQKKMGNDVGLSGSSGLFKSAGEDQETGKSSSTAAKSIASSWRKLRSKSSTPAMGILNGQKDGLLSGPTMASLPMTSSSAVASARSHLNRKIAPPPTPTQLTNVQPVHAAYMSSLARLFDAAQVLDGIARQVEDPGLKCSNKTQVGLELGVKNAAEFFAFFIIRFVMADLMLMVDKFLKRGSEWVLA